MLAIRLIGGVVATLGALPLLFALVPGTRTWSVGGIPLPWITLGVLAYPVMYFAAVYYVRAAERIEESFSDLVSRG
jgi:hypothetical protein